MENIDLRFESGRLSGIMGPNGAGKTTCFNVLTGRFKPDRGRVIFDGEDITGLSPDTIVRKGISRSFQIMSLFDEYSALENVLIAVPEVRERGFNMVERLAMDGEAADRASGVLARVGLSGREHRGAGALAYGERRALEIGVALAARPRLLFLDEPTSGLGTEATARLADLVQDLKRDYSIVVIEHDMQFLFGLADTISVIPLGSGDRQRHPRCATREQMGPAVESGRAGVILEIADIETFHGETQALFGVSLRVGQGEVVALLGQSGGRQDDHLAIDPGPHAGKAGDHQVRRKRHHDQGNPRDRPAGRRLGAGRSPHFPHPDRGAKPVDRSQANPVSVLVPRRDVRGLLRARAPD